MPAPIELQLDPQDVIAALTAQRNAAMDEVAKQAGIIAALSRHISQSTEAAPAEVPNAG